MTSLQDIKICIYGVGAIGSHIAVPLTLAGLQVSVIGRGAHLAAIKANGLTLVSGSQTRTAHPKAFDNPAQVGPQDFVIVTLKSHQAWEIAPDLAPLLGPNTAVVTAQNGVPWWYFYGLKGPLADKRLASVDPGNRQWDAIGPHRVIGSTVYAAAELAEPGVIKHTYGNRYGLGEPTGQTTERVSQLAAAFEAGGLEPKVHADIRNDIWLKLWGNLCFNPISALTEATMDIIATDPGTRAIATKMMQEAEQVAHHIGVEFPVTLERRIDGAARVGAHRTSMLQDLDRNRQIELDALLTVVREIAQHVGVETPTIEMILALTQQLGQTRGVYPVFP